MVNDTQSGMIPSGTPIDRGDEAPEIAGIAFRLQSDGAPVGPTVHLDGGRLILNDTVPVND